MTVPTLFVILKISKQPDVPTVGEYSKKLWYIQSMEYYSARKRTNYTYHNMEELQNNYTE